MDQMWFYMRIIGFQKERQEHVFKIHNLIKINAHFPPSLVRFTERSTRQSLLGTKLRIPL